MNYSEAKAVLDRQEAAEAVLRQYEKLANAHEQFGYSSRRELLRALEELEASERPQRRGSRGLSPETVDRILRLKSEGKSNTAISKEVGVSPLTVAKYVKGQQSQAPAPKPAPKTASKPAAKSKAKGRAKKK